jgi:hypothetical protein
LRAPYQLPKGLAVDSVRQLAGPLPVHLQSWGDQIFIDAPQKEQEGAQVGFEKLPALTF